MSIYFAYLYSLLIIIGLELSLIKPTFFLLTALIVILLNIIFIWLAMRAKFSSLFWNFLISPFLFLTGGLLFLGFSDNWIIKELLIAFITICNTIFIYWLIIHSYYKYKYKKHSLANISRIINLSAVFFWFTTLANIYVFFRISIWLLISLAAIINFFLFYQFFNINKIKWQTARPFVIILSAILLEFFYILTWLPFLSLVKAILIMSIYYFLTGLAKHYIEASLAKTVYLRYGLITLTIWIIVLTTARWG